MICAKSRKTVGYDDLSFAVCCDSKEHAKMVMNLGEDYWWSVMKTSDVCSMKTKSMNQQLVVQ